MHCKLQRSVWNGLLIEVFGNCHFRIPPSSQRSVWKNGKVREAGHVRTEEEKARFFMLMLMLMLMLKSMLQHKRGGGAGGRDQLA